MDKIKENFKYRLWLVIKFLSFHNGKDAEMGV